MFKINEAFIKNDIIDRGAYGVIKPYQTVINSRKYVVKEINVRDIRNINFVINEAMIGFNHDHPFVLPVLGCSYNQTKQKFFIKMKRMSSNLKEWRRNQKGQIEREMYIRNFYRLASALHYLHNKKQVHCDIKANNILLDNNNNMFLADLGLNKFLGEDGSLSDISSLAGTEIYMAPEIWEYYGSLKNSVRDLTQKGKMKKRELYSGDVWSLGITFLDFYSGGFKGVDYKTTEIDSELRDQLSARLKEVPDSYGKDILKGMLEIDVKKRLNFDQVCDLLEKKFSDILEETYEIQARKILHRNVVCRKFCELEKQDQFVVTKQISIKPDEPLKVDDVRFEEMMKDFQKRLNEDIDAKIKTISIDMSWCHDLTDNGLEHLLIDFPKKDKTEVLSLNFSNCEKITDKGLEQLFGQNLPNLKNLKELSLDFSGCTEITDQGLKVTIEKICSNLLSLQTLSINFSECIKIQNRDMTLKWMGVDLNQMPDLKDIYLDFARCEGIDESIRKDLQKELGRYKNLEIY